MFGFLNYLVLCFQSLVMWGLPPLCRQVLQGPLLSTCTTALGCVGFEMFINTSYIHLNHRLFPCIWCTLFVRYSNFWPTLSICAHTFKFLAYHMDYLVLDHKYKCLDGGIEVEHSCVHFKNEGTLQGKHTVAEVVEEVFTVTKLRKIIKKTCTKTFAIHYGGFSTYFI